MKPVRPEDVFEEEDRKHCRSFPKKVIASFNKMIKRTFSNGSAVFNQNDVIAVMVKKGLSKKDILANGWLHVEDEYRRLGWIVNFDETVYPQPSVPTFTFSKPN